MYLPEYIKKIFVVLERNDIECYVVGGCVRDSIIGLVPSDYDMCAAATPDELTKILSEYFKIIPTGIKHGTISVLTQDGTVELTSFRKDSSYSDNRHPDSVIFTKDIREDLARRDFTMNALCYAPKTGYIDIFNGFADIKNKIIRTVGDPDQRFSEDALRIIRALRFSSQLDFEIEKNTADSIKRNYHLLENVAWERILSETDKLLNGSCKCLNSERDIFVFLYGDYPKDAAKKIVRAKNIAVKYYFLLQNNSCDKLSEITRKMKFSEKIRKNILFLKKYNNISHGTELEIKFVISQFGVERSKILFDMFDSEENTNGRYSYVVEKILSENICLDLKHLDINGNDLKEIGINGKNIGVLLNKLLKMVIMGEVENNKKKLLKSIEKTINI